MENNKGWISLHRKIEDNPLWFLEKFTKAQAWIDLFLNANHKDGIICIRDNIIDIKRGQIGWSQITMSKRWKWSRNKVRRFLEYLVKAKMIKIDNSEITSSKLKKTTQQTIQQKNKYFTTIITILNYEEYQQDDKTIQQTIQQTSSRRYINNNVNNDNNKKRGGFTPPSLNEIKEYCLIRKNNVSAEQFFNFYESKGWLVGKTKMKNWKAAVHTWENRDIKINNTEDEVYIPNYAKSYVNKNVDKK